MSLGRPPAQFAATLDRLRASVRAGQYDASGLLPGERDLSVTLAVSRTTLRRAVSALVDEGLLVHRHGVGTFIATALTPAAPASAAPPLAIGGFTDAMIRVGRVPSTRGLSHCVVAPTAEQAMLLGGSSRDRLVRLRRVRYADDEPVMIEEASLPEPFSPDLSAFEGSLYAALTARGIVPMRALQRVQAGLATVSDAAAVQVAVGSPLVLLRRTDYLADGRCCLLTEARVRPDRIDLLIEFGSAPGFVPAAP